MFSRRSLIASTTSSRRPHRVTSLPASARTSEKAVPHDPALNTAILRHRLRFLLVGGCPVGVVVAGCRSRARRVARGSYRSAGAVPPRRSATIPVMAAMIRSVASAVVAGGRAAAATRSSSGTGSPAFITMFLRGSRCGLLRVGRQDLLGTPLPDRDHRAAGGERDPGGTGLALHRPQVGVAGQRALGIDHDALAAPIARDRSVVGTDGVAAQPLDRDLAGRARGSRRAPCWRTAPTWRGSAGAGRGRRRSAPTAAGRRGRCG